MQLLSFKKERLFFFSGRLLKHKHFDSGRLSKWVDVLWQNGVVSNLNLRNVDHELIEIFECFYKTNLFFFFLFYRGRQAFRFILFLVKKINKKVWPLGGKLRIFFPWKWDIQTNIIRILSSVLSISCVRQNNKLFFVFLFWQNKIRNFFFQKIK